MAVSGPGCPASGAFWVCVESFLGLLRDLDGKFPTVLVPIRAGLVPTPCLDDVSIVGIGCKIQLKCQLSLFSAPGRVVHG
uniref:Uncharacterized protein n=1 Tax=Coccidioides posadasii RMSCC 3488 TaxID=454284 RepID=A0A0J6IKJ7_COCPO|nr:hypothetical protein CPAG_08766 [Coccidioides posadasii RMSCC 3488]